MSERTLVTELAWLTSRPILAEFSLLFLLVSRLVLLFLSGLSRRGGLCCKGKLLSSFTFRTFECGRPWEVWLRFELGSEVIEVFVSLQLRKVLAVIRREIVSPNGCGGSLRGLSVNNVFVPMFERRKKEAISSSSACGHESVMRHLRQHLGLVIWNFLKEWVAYLMVMFIWSYFRHVDVLWGKPISLERTSHFFTQRRLLVLKFPCFQPTRFKFKSEN